MNALRAPRNHGAAFGDVVAGGDRKIKLTIQVLAPKIRNVTGHIYAALLQRFNRKQLHASRIASGVDDINSVASWMAQQSLALL